MSTNVKNIMEIVNKSASTKLAVIDVPAIPLINYVRTIQLVNQFRYQDKHNRRLMSIGATPIVTVLFD